MGEKAKEALRVQFDKRLRLEFHGPGLLRMGDCWTAGNLMERWS
jgi:hypothetical protein